MSSPPRHYDVVVLSDFRYPGGTAASVAEEVKAQAALGYSTALVQLDAPQMNRGRSFNRRIAGCLSAGLADLVEPGASVHAKLLTIRQPRLFTEPPRARPRIRADSTLLIVNQPPHDGLRPASHPYYEVGAVHERLERLFGEVLWAPIGPGVRQTLAETSEPLALREEDWLNVLDVDEWRVDRTRRRDERPVIGRHSRGHPAKWLMDPVDLRAAYPDDDTVRVEILGGAEPAFAALKRRPARWVVHPFGTMAPQRFLAGIDTFVYYHHPAWSEAFGRNILEAMASGAPAVLPAHFEPLFGTACLYAPPRGARALWEALHEDPERYAEQSSRGLEFVRRACSVEAHGRRLAELIGPPENEPTPGRRHRAAEALPGEPTPAEEELGWALERERSDRLALEREIDVIRASTTFRLGVAIGLAIRRTIHWRPGRLTALLALKSLRAANRRRRATPRRPSRPHGTTILFVAWGADEAGLNRLAERVERMRRILVGFEPLFLTTSEEPHPLQERGHSVEHVVTLEEWRRTRPPEAWSRYVTDRVAAIAAEHEPDTVVIVEPATGISAIEQGVLDAIVLPALHTGEDNLLRPASRDPLLALEDLLREEL